LRCRGVERSGREGQEGDLTHISSPLSWELHRTLHQNVATISRARSWYRDRAVSGKQVQDALFASEACHLWASISIAFSRSQSNISAALPPRTAFPWPRISCSGCPLPYCIPSLFDNRDCHMLSGIASLACSYAPLFCLDTHSATPRPLRRNRCPAQCPFHQDR
jgi:hypothetical protein